MELTITAQRKPNSIFPTVGQVGIRASGLGPFRYSKSREGVLLIPAVGQRACVRTAQGKGKVLVTQSCPTL